MSTPPRQSTSTLPRGAREPKPGRPGRPSTPGRASKPSTVDRFAARAAQRRRWPFIVRLLRWLVPAVLLLGGLAAYLVLASPVLTVATVRVTGVPASAAGEIRDRARVPMKERLIDVDTHAVASRVLVPDLASVTVRRSWPRTLVISVVPRVAVLAVANAQGKVEVWDRYGTAFGTADAAPVGVPVLDSSQSDLTPVAVRSVTAVLQGLPSAQRQHVSHVTVSSAGLVRFRLGRVQVVWGDATQGALKEKVLKALTPQAHSRIDVSAPETPAVR